MTLQELHELTGKVLKERPELAAKDIQTAFHTTDFEMFTFDTKSNCFYLQSKDIYLRATEEVLWKAN